MFPQLSKTKAPGGCIISRQTDATGEPEVCVKRLCC